MEPSAASTARDLGHAARTTRRLSARASKPAVVAGRRAWGDEQSTPAERLGRRCVRHRAVVLVAWAVALAGVVLASHAAGLRTSSDPALPGTQSDRARKVVEREVHVPAGAAGRVVYGVDAGMVTAPRFRAAIEASMARIRAAAHVASVTSPFTPAGGQGLSPGRKVAYASVWLDIAAG